MACAAVDEGALEGTPGRRTRSATKGKGTGTNMLYVKGAPEHVLERCTHARLKDGSKVRNASECRCPCAKVS